MCATLENARCANTGRKSKTKKCERPNLTSNMTAPQPRPIELSEEQAQALNVVPQGLRDPTRQLVLIKGYAGVGKTSLAARIPAIYPGNIAFAAPTGKASAVMRSRGCEGATTLHRLLYGPPENVIDRDGREQRNFILRRELDLDVVVVDEASMVDRKLAHDLASVARKIVAIQDPEQLPPVHGNAGFTSEPDVFLKEVHRQAAGSEVIRIATAIRQGVQPPSVRSENSLMLEADIILCATNDLRRHYNSFVRYHRRLQSRLPIAGERVVCLRNNYRSGLLNGVIYTVAEIAESAGDYVSMILRDEDGIEYEAPAPKFCFGQPVDPNSIDRQFDLFDYGYALTVHKSQGSEWRRVCVLDESRLSGFRYIAENSGLPFEEFRRRWWYTAVTRASEHIDLVEFK